MAHQCTVTHKATKKVTVKVIIAMPKNAILTGQCTNPKSNEV